MQKEIKIIHFPKRDEPYVILAKPSGIPSAPINPDEKDNALSMAINYFPEIKNVSGKKSVEYGLLHRIDTDTNGLLLIATSQSFYDYMIEEQQQGRFIKTYKAICEADKNNAEFLGGFPELKINPYELSENKTIVLESFFRNYGEGLKAVRPVTEDSGMAALKKIGKKQIYATNVISINTINNSEIAVMCKISAGYRHQVRCHLAWLGLPVIGDKLYNRNMKKSSLMFSAVGLEFYDQITGNKIEYFQE